MKASIIIPTYKQMRFLPDALSSVIMQDFPKIDYEILVVDNAPYPTPELEALCPSGNLPSLRYIHEPRNGLHNARHAGARAAQGEILIYIDDDVICPSQWLEAMMVPYENPQVANVAGKVLLRYENEPPAWLEQFRGMLSALDRGAVPRAIEPYGSPVGCNMSIRKSVLFDVGGFNPDGFGDRSLIHLRGDGECGLARKVHEASWTVWYAPDAWLEHRVPQTRMSFEYLLNRANRAGVEAVYSVYRYKGLARIAIFISAMFPKYLARYMISRIQKKKESSRIRQQIALSFYRSCFQQTMRLLMSRSLRVYTKAIEYL